MAPKMCLKSPGTDVGAAGFERCPRTFETHFITGEKVTSRRSLRVSWAATARKSTQLPPGG